MLIKQLEFPTIFMKKKCYFIKFSFKESNDIFNIVAMFKLFQILKIMKFI